MSFPISQMFSTTLNADGSARMTNPGGTVDLPGINPDGIITDPATQLPLGSPASSSLLDTSWLETVQGQKVGDIQDLFQRIQAFIQDNPLIAGAVGVGLLLMVLHTQSNGGRRRY